MTALLDPKLARAERVVMNLMNDILAQFHVGARITVIVRRPGSDDQDFLITDDDLHQVTALIERRLAA